MLQKIYEDSKMKSVLETRKLNGMSVTVGLWLSNAFV